MTTVSTTVNGQILHEKRGERETYYRPDTLGNVIATTSTTGTVRSTHTYWPYGEVRTSTGSSASPFKYVGTLGYYSDSGTMLYVRARYYRPAQTRWMTVDPLWPRQRAYCYVRGAPVVVPDPSGLIPLACALACTTVAGCVAGMLWACKDWYPGYPSWRSCAVEFIASLPWTQRAACLAGLFGCLACLMKSRVIPVLIGGLLPALYGHGNCCGFSKRCLGCETEANGLAIDCVDEACALHDDCLGTVFEYVIHQVKCNSELCKRVIACQDSGRCKTARCNEVANEIRLFYCTLSGI